MTGLVDFLTARLDEDEAIAQAAANESHEATWDFSTHGDSVHTTEHGAAVVVGPYEYLDETIQLHIARHDPARVLADVAAKRAILKVHNVWSVVFPRDSDEYHDRHCVGCGFNAVEEYHAEDVNDCPVLCALALPFADHPDYREEWRP